MRSDFGCVQAEASYLDLARSPQLMAGGLGSASLTQLARRRRPHVAVEPQGLLGSSEFLLPDPNFVDIEVGFVLGLVEGSGQGG